eukprot:6191692-Pleurochrysis_carterae.AAC.2
MYFDTQSDHARQWLRKRREAVKKLCSSAHFTRMSTLNFSLLSRRARLFVDLGERGQAAVCRVGHRQGLLRRLALRSAQRRLAR